MSESAVSTLISIFKDFTTKLNSLTFVDCLLLSNQESARLFSPLTIYTILLHFLISLSISSFASFKLDWFLISNSISISISIFKVNISVSITYASYSYAMQLIYEAALIAFVCFSTVSSFDLIVFLLFLKVCCFNSRI